MRKEYLLGFDEFKTDRERASAIIKKSVNRRTCVEQLIVLHGYSIEELTTPDGKIRIAEFTDCLAAHTARSTEVAALFV